MPSLLRSPVWRVCSLALLVELIGFAHPAQAATVTFVDAGRGEADFTTGAGTLTITLTDLVVNPGSIADNISGLGFDIAPSAGATLTSQTGGLRSVNGGAVTGTYVDLFGGADQTLYWNFDASTLFLSALGTARPGGLPPDETILGAPNVSDGEYHGGGSINGNRPHNPFVNGTATFVLAIPGVTPDTIVTSAIFRFGTNPTGGFEDGNCTVGCEPPGDIPAPEPTSLLLLGTGLIGGGMLFRRRRGVSR